MGWRFRKSVKIAPGVRLNFSKKSTSVTLGGKIARTTISSTGRRTRSVSIPGTGLSYVETTSAKKEEASKQKTYGRVDLTAQERIRRIRFNRITLSIFFALLALIIAGCCSSSTAVIAWAVGGLIAVVLVNTNAASQIKKLSKEMEEEP